MDMLPSMAFFKGMEEAKMLLPGDFVVVDSKNKFNMDGETEPGMGSKQIAALVDTDSESEETVLEILARLMLKA